MDKISRDKEFNHNNIFIAESGDEGFWDHGKGMI